MRKIYKLSLTVFIALTISFSLFAQNNFFTDAGENKLVPTSGQRVIIPQKFRTSGLDVLSMKNFLWSLPSEQNFITNRNNAPIISLPMPDGGFARFHVWESSIQEPGLAARFPEIRTFAGQGIDDPYATIRFDYNPYFGFSAQILSPNGRIYIDPYAKREINNYISYYQRDNRRRSPFICSVEDGVSEIVQSRTTAGPCLGTQLRTYRLAVSCTGEYAVAVGGGAAGPTHAAIVASVNRITGVYEVELAIRLVLIANNDLIEYLNGATDPFTNVISTTLLNQNQANTDAVIGFANYDIGHIFTSDNNGLAQLNAVCGAGKARGATGAPVLVGDGFDIDYVAHEMGHQFGANHTFNSNTCASPGGSYEPGSGTSIMAYAGICAATENIQPNSDPIFHAMSFDEIGNFVTSGAGAGCVVLTATGNTLPVITSMGTNNVSIPINTPFVLTGAATDADGDAITYNWDGWDVGVAGSWPSAATSTTRPLFRQRVSKTTGSRTFPDIRVIAANYPGTGAPSVMDGLRGEVLPLVARVMKFRLTVRDNRAGGGGIVSSGEGCQSVTTFQVNAVGTTPFSVTIPNGGESYPGGSAQTVTWNAAGTTAAPYNVTDVKISFSTDGGLTYPTVILASTPNDGSESVTIPGAATTTARIKVEAVGNIFFDISNSNFTVTAPVSGFSFNSPATVTAACPAPDVMTSGNLTATYIGAFTGNINLTGVVVPAGPTVSFSNNPLTTGLPSTTVSLTGMALLAPGNYTVTVTGVGVAGPTLTRDITFTINPSTGPAVTGQPANQTVCSGANASFSVTATGTYQWQVSTAAVPAFTNIGGQTAATLNLVGVTAGMSGNQYRCVVTGQCGSTNSNAATLTVNVAPAVTGNPASLSVCSGSAVNFTAAASGTPAPTYQWQVSTTAVPAFTDIPAATSATYNIASTTVAMNNNQYRCVITNTCGTVNTTAATLLVSSSVTITGNPANQTVCEATNTSFTVAADGSGLTYQWQVSTDGGANYNNLANGGVYSGATSATLAITGVPPSLNGYRYRAVVSSGVCAPGISTGALLTVNTFPVITAQPVNVTICEGAAATFSVAATTGVGTLSYQWQLSTNGGTTYTNLTGATTSSFAQASVPVGQNSYRFRVIVTAGCGSVISNAGLMTVNAYPVITFNPTISVVCISDGAFGLSASPAGGAFSGTGVSGSTFTPSVAGLGTKTVTYTVSNAGCQSAVSRVVQVNECAERHLTLEQYPAVIVYPVPSSGDFSIRLNTDLYTKLNIKLYNSLGQLVKSEVATGLGYGSVIPVHTFNLPNGTYQLFLTNDERGGVSRRGQGIIIQKL